MLCCHRGGGSGSRARESHPKLRPRPDDEAHGEAGVAVGDGFIVWPDVRNDPGHENDPALADNFDIYLYPGFGSVGTRLADSDVETNG